MNRKLAFIGATGMIGLPVAIQLADAGFIVTALVRNRKKARSKLPESINLVEGDLRDQKSLTTLLAGQDFLYLNLNLQRNEKQNDFHTETDGLVAILGAAEKAQIKRIGFVSSLVMNHQGVNGFNWWVFDVKKKAVDLIKKSAIPYSIFHPSTFMENFHSTYRMGNRVLLAGTSRYKMYFISAIDFGKQVAESFRILNDESKEYVIQGLEGFTADEAAYQFVNNYKSVKLSISKAPLGMLRFFGKFSTAMNYGANIIEALNNYEEKFEATGTWNELGKPTITLRNFAAGKY